MSFSPLNIKALALGFCTIFFVLTFAVPQAHALSCVMPVLNDAAIENADLIFQGKALKIKGKSASKPNGVEKMQDFVFSIDKVWKGHLESDHVTISANTYWGDPFVIGDEHLVVAHVEGEKYRTYECGNTSHISSAGDKIEILKMKFGTQDKDDNTGEN